MITENKLKKLKIEYVPGTMKPNLFHIPVTHMTPNIENSEIFNNVFKEVVSYTRGRKFQRTRSNGICLKHLVLPCYDVEILKTKTGIFTGVELVVLTGLYMFRLQFNSRPHTQVSGNRAFLKFRQICTKFDLDLNNYKISKQEGLKYKSKIPDPLIYVTHNGFLNVEFDEVHHIDFHSSFAGGLKITVPEFKPIIDYLFSKRKEHPVYKDVLNCSIGFMQSNYIGFQFSHLSYKAITNNNKRVSELAELIDSLPNNVVLLFNTDGFWYKGPIYHGKGEGDQCGQWCNDHTNCKLRIKSAGAYEYIEDGIYHPVLRGLCKYDKIKPREEWEWGDIYRDDTKPIAFVFSEEEGVKYYEVKE